MILSKTMILRYWSYIRWSLEMDAFPNAGFKITTNRCRNDFQVKYDIAFGDSYYISNVGFQLAILKKKIKKERKEKDSCPLSFPPKITSNVLQFVHIGQFQHKNANFSFPP